MYNVYYKPFTKEDIYLEFSQETLRTIFQSIARTNQKIIDFCVRFANVARVQSSKSADRFVIK